ncbi:acidic proline-rich protein PRP25-like [Harpegnathos saltator]|nr:acidic proline-rich protein PRP25-like [Harpegnathos saltator]
MGIRISSLYLNVVLQPPTVATPPRPEDESGRGGDRRDGEETEDPLERQLIAILTEESPAKTGLVVGGVDGSEKSLTELTDSVAEEGTGMATHRESRPEPDRPRERPPEPDLPVLSPPEPDQPRRNTQGPDRKRPNLGEPGRDGPDPPEIPVEEAQKPKGPADALEEEESEKN